MIIFCGRGLDGEEGVVCMNKKFLQKAPNLVGQATRGISHHQLNLKHTLLYLNSYCDCDDIFQV